MRFFAGDPLSVSALITAASRPISRSQARQGAEPTGPIAGDHVAASFLFPNALPGYFASRASDVPNNGRFGVTLFGSKGAICVPLTAVPSDPAFILRSPDWAQGAWQRLEPPSAPRVQTRHPTNQLKLKYILWRRPLRTLL